MGFTQLFEYPSQNTTLKTVSVGFKDGKNEPVKEKVHRSYIHIFVNKQFIKEYSLLIDNSILSPLSVMQYCFSKRNSGLL